MDTTIEHILVATDLSDNARHAFDYAAMLAERLDSRLTVLYVIETLSASARLLVSDMVGESRLKSLEKEKQEQVLAAVKNRVEAFCRQREDPGCPAAGRKVKVVQGQPAEAIVTIATAEACDLVVVGSRGHGMVAEAMMGSTSRRVLRRSPCPVLVVRPPDNGKGNA